MDITISLITTLVLTLINGYFSMSEMALTTAKRAVLEHEAEEGDKRAERAVKLAADSDQLLATIQVAITLVGFASSAVSKQVVGPLSFFQKIARPLVWLTGACSDGLARILRIKSADDRQNVSEEEIKYMVSEQDDLLDEEKRMIHEIFDLGDTVAREVMVPRVDTTMCEDDETVADVLSTMRQTGFSRIPVYHEDPDNVAGIAHIKDLIQPALDGKGDQPIAGFLRDATFVPDTKDILPLLSEMQTSHDQIVVVVDEYGGTAGIITIDPDNKYLTRLSRREWLVDGRFSCDDAIELGWPLEESDDYETIAGWILELCDSVPDIGEVFEVAGYKFKVQSMRGQRISLIRVIAPAETDKKDSESSVDEPTTSGAGSANPHDGDE